MAASRAPARACRPRPPRENVPNRRPGSRRTGCASTVAAVAKSAAVSNSMAARWRRRRGRPRRSRSSPTTRKAQAFARERVENGTETLEVVARGSTSSSRRRAGEPAVPTSNLRIQPLRAGEVAPALVALLARERHAVEVRAPPPPCATPQRRGPRRGEPSCEKSAAAVRPRGTFRCGRRRAPRKGSFSPRTTRPEDPPESSRAVRAAELADGRRSRRDILGDAPRIMSIELRLLPGAASPRDPRRSRGSPGASPFGWGADGEPHAADAPTALSIRRHRRRVVGSDGAGRGRGVSRVRLCG